MKHRSITVQITEQLLRRQDLKLWHCNYNNGSNSIFLIINLSFGTISETRWKSWISTGLIKLNDVVPVGRLTFLIFVMGHQS